MLKKRTIFVVLTAMMLLVGLYLLRTADHVTTTPPVPQTSDTLTELKVKIETLAQQQAERPDYSKIWGAFTAFLAALFSGIKVLNDMSNKPLELRLEAIANDSKTQFTRVFQTLDVLEDSIVRKSVTDQLRAVVRGYIHYNRTIDERTRMLIDSQCERLIVFSEEVMAENYKLENWEQTEAKMEVQAMAGRTQAKELFGAEYLEHYKVIQAEALHDFHERLCHIVKDQLVNSKYTRYRNAAETFLHQIITETLAMTHKWNKRHEKRPHRQVG